jgi:hypothetical protein
VGNYADAIELDLVALAFIEFDSHRLPGVDPSEVANALQTHYLRLLPPEDSTAFVLYMRHRYHGRAKPSYVSACAALRRIGPPTYEPRYLLPPSRQLHSGQPENPLRPDLNVSEAWEHAIEHLRVCTSGALSQAA